MKRKINEDGVREVWLQSKTWVKGNGSPVVQLCGPVLMWSWKYRRPSKSCSIQVLTPMKLTYVDKLRIVDRELMSVAGFREEGTGSDDLFHKWEWTTVKKIFLRSKLDGGITGCEIRIGEKARWQTDEVSGSVCLWYRSSKTDVRFSLTRHNPAGWKYGCCHLLLQPTLDVGPRWFIVNGRCACFLPTALALASSSNLILIYRVTFVVLAHSLECVIF